MTERKVVEDFHFKSLVKLRNRLFSRKTEGVQRCIENPVENLQWAFFSKIVNG